MLESLLTGMLTISAPLVYQLPVPGAVVRPFIAPVSDYGAGHRGVDLATTGGSLVRSAGPGTVSFAGYVAGRGLVVVIHPDGVSTEYEPLQPSVRAGEAVSGGTALGVVPVSGVHGACMPGGCLHWGARRAGAYFDPLTLLRPLGPVRLLPWDDSG